MSRMSALRHALEDRRGGVAVEYAMVLPLFVMAIMGTLWAGLLMFSTSSLDLAVQSAARCMAVDAVNCSSPAATESFARRQYAGPSLSPVFTATTSGCGHTVTGQASFDLNILPGINSVPLSVSACYP